jgi:hypothetical protein
MDSYDVHVHSIEFSDKESFWTFNIIKNIFKYNTILFIGQIDIVTFKGVALRYGRQLYFHCLLNYMVTRVFEIPPSLQASWQHRFLHWIWVALKTMTPFHFIFL